MSADVHDWTVEVALAVPEPLEPAAERADRGSMVGAPAVDLIAYGRILAAEHPYGSQERELLTALAEALAARQPVEILAQMGRLQAKERTARERIEVLERGRLVSTAAHLRTLPPGTVLRADADDLEVWHCLAEGWTRAGRQGCFPNALVPLPAHIIYEPPALAEVDHG
ncbi:hypothetical protein GTU73_08885 [Rathayibacter sp. VKM Ac-2804]|uniref:hypothetical protein n=1 Tax=Rathayibacter sp. VKM Ac-2804 TaxID=2609257 RepID=UPI00132E949C|nr:hypothetical protein [Rathayibacter sp. VKM Ac-2804]QHF24114.1 hypothetical protein GTU73_08885 [Rathayibacter sp. VKM Ac-2804]